MVVTLGPAAERRVRRSARVVLGWTGGRMVATPTVMPRRSDAVARARPSNPGRHLPRRDLRPPATGPHERTGARGGSPAGHVPPGVRVRRRVGGRGVDPPGPPRGPRPLAGAAPGGRPHP